MFEGGVIVKYWRKPLDADTIEIPCGEIHILENQCKGCGFCVEYCPREVLKLSDGYNLKGYHPPIVLKAEECVHCQLCEIICPEFAIFVTRKDNRPVSEAVPEVMKEVVPIES
jgi:2-oxoglutarate ferredoxin oxidoreductase subunit delta